MNQELQIPDQPVMMVTNRDFRLSTLTGFVVNFEANVPTQVWPQAYEDALAIGAVLADEQPEPKLVEDKPLVDPSVAEAAKKEEEAKIEYTQTAILKLMARGDNTDFNASGYPKVNKVVAELPPHAPRPTATEIQEIFDLMKADVSLAELD